MQLPINEILDKYKKGASLHELAEQYQTYANKILRLLRKLKIEIRSKGEAQKSAVKRGRRKHPTEGTVRSQEEKEKISASLEDFYDKLDPAGYNKIVSRAKKNWKKLTDETRTEMRRKSAESNRVAAKEGSAVEKYVHKFLLEAGYVVQYHKKDILSTNLEVDMYLPNNATAIEIDGPSHFEPIWGEEALKKQIKFDGEKNGILLNLGLVVLRVKYDRSKLTLGVKKKLKREILKVLKDIEISFPKQNDRLINIEI